MTPAETLTWINQHTSDATYYDHELLRLIELVRGLPHGAHVCEIGVYRGRTAAVYFLEQVRRRAHDNTLSIDLVDSWELDGLDAWMAFDGMIEHVWGQMGVDVEYTDHWKSSHETAQAVPNDLDLLHIDGDHDHGVWDDCALYIPKVKPGGLVVAHDYGKLDEYPQVTLAVDQYIPVESSAWERLPVVGSQFVARRIA